MIFREPLLAKVLDGSKTVTRRPVKTTTAGAGTPSMTTPQNLLTPCRYEVGKTYAVQPGRGKKAVARIRVLDVRREKLLAITTADARREGFYGGPEFVAYWRKLYGSVTASQLVDRIEFELVEVAE